MIIINVDVLFIFFIFTGFPEDLLPSIMYVMENECKGSVREFLIRKLVFNFAK